MQSRIFSVVFFFRYENGVYRNTILGPCNTHFEAVITRCRNYTAPAILMVLSRYQRKVKLEFINVVFTYSRIFFKPRIAREDMTRRVYNRKYHRLWANSCRKIQTLMIKVFAQIHSVATSTLNNADFNRRMARLFAKPSYDFVRRWEKNYI